MAGLQYFSLEVKTVGWTFWVSKYWSAEIDDCGKRGVAESGTDGRVRNRRPPLEPFFLGLLCCVNPLFCEAARNSTLECLPRRGPSTFRPFQ